LDESVLVIGEQIDSLETNERVTPSRSITHLDLLVLVVCAASMVIYVPGVTLEYWTPPTVVNLFVLPIGVLTLIRSVIARDRAATAASVFLAWAAIVSLSSRAPKVALFGAVGRDSVLMLAAIFGGWALGRTLGTEARRLLGWVVVGIAATSGLIAILQVAVQSDVGGLALQYGRPTGISGGPIGLSAQAVAGAAFFAYRYFVRGRSVDAVAYAGFTFVTALTGSRIAIAVALGLAVIVVAKHRTMRSGGLLACFVPALLAAQGLHRWAGSDASAVDRANTGGIQDRLDLWGWGLRAWTHRPLGYGVGRFRPAAQLYFSDAWASRQGLQDEWSWFDPHNYLVGVLVCTGVVGLALFTWFLFHAARRLNSPFKWMIAAVTLTWLVEPALPGVYMMTAILLGAAACPPERLVLAARTSRAGITTTVAVVLGVALGAIHVYADATAVEAMGDPDAYPLTRSYFWNDAVFANSVVVVHHDPADPDPAERDLVLGWTKRATEREPDFPTWWALLGIRAIAFGDLELARDAGERGVALQPNHPLSLTVLKIVGERTGDDELAKDAKTKLCAVGLGDCGT
jgi:hypothetical protein